MTIGTTLNVATHLTDGLATEFPFYFTVLEKEHLMVVLRTLSGTVVKTYAQNEFTVGGLGGNAGTVSILPAPADDHELIVLRAVPFLQQTDIVNQGGFLPEVVERQLDLLTMQAQQLNERLNRAIVSELGDPAYTLGRLTSGDIIQFLGGKLIGISLEEAAAPARAAAAEAQGYASALLTYTFGYIGTTSTPPPGVEDGEGYVYVIDGRVYGALNDGGSPDVQFELLTKALAEEGGVGSGTVTSVQVSGGATGLSFSGGPITDAGTLTLSGILGLAHGGTGADTEEEARDNLGAAKSGANDDITSLRQSTLVEEVGVPVPSSIGFLGLPLAGNEVGSLIIFGLSNSSKLTLNTTGGWRIPANTTLPFERGTVLMGYNDSASPQTVAIVSDTMRLAGSALTGTRTVAPRGLFRAVKIKPTEWLIEGHLS